MDRRPCTGLSGNRHLDLPRAPVSAHCVLLLEQHGSRRAQRVINAAQFFIRLAATASAKRKGKDNVYLSSHRGPPQARAVGRTLKIRTYEFNTKRTRATRFQHSIRSWLDLRVVFTVHESVPSGVVSHIRVAVVRHHQVQICNQAARPTSTLRKSWHQQDATA